MRTAAICPTCATYENALCIIYNGPGLANINVSPLDNLEQIIQNVNNNLVPISGSGVPSNSATYLGQIYIDTSTSIAYIAQSVGGGPLDWAQLTNASSLNYKSYVARISQSGTSAPTVTYLMENTLTNPVTFSYNGVGNFTINCADITPQKTVVFFQQSSGFNSTTFILSPGIGSITMSCLYGTGATPVNGAFFDSSIEIRVYN